MQKRMKQSKPEPPALAKALTGIDGFDEITGGGLPRGRTSLIAGSAGAGKTLFGMEFIYRGATQFGEPGVFMAFEENETELVENVASLGFDLDALVKRNQLVIDLSGSSAARSKRPANTISKVCLSAWATLSIK